MCARIDCPDFDTTSLPSMRPQGSHSLVRLTNHLFGHLHSAICLSSLCAYAFARPPTRQSRSALRLPVNCQSIDTTQIFSHWLSNQECAAESRSFRQLHSEDVRRIDCMNNLRIMSRCLPRLARSRSSTAHPECLARRCAFSCHSPRDMSLVW